MTSFSQLSPEQQLLFRGFACRVSDDLKLRRSGHTGLIFDPEYEVAYTRYSFIKPLLRGVSAYTDWVEAVEKAHLEPEIIALESGKAIILQPNETADEAFSRWAKSHPSVILSDPEITRYGSQDKVPAVMARLKSEFLFIPSTWKARWIETQEAFIAWLNGFIEEAAQEPEAVKETGKRIGRPPGTFKNVKTADEVA